MSKRLAFLQSGRPGGSLIIVLLGLLLAACGDSATPLAVGAIVTPTPNASPTVPSVAATNQATLAPTSATVANSGFKGENFLTLPQNEIVSDLACGDSATPLAVGAIVTPTPNGLADLSTSNPFIGPKCSRYQPGYPRSNLGNGCQ